MTETSSLAAQLLDAQVAWAVDLLTGAGLEEQVARDVDDLLAATGGLRLDQLADADRVKRVARRLFATVPGSTAGDHLTRRTAEIVHAGPATPLVPGQVLAREHVEAIVTEVVGASRLAHRTLDELAESPLVAAVASRFVSRLVGEVLAANKAVADKIPGMGPLVSLGSSAASRMKGAADKQFESLIGATAGKGTTFAVKRLNKVILETLADPATRAAVLEVWDLHADRPLPAPSAVVEEEDVLRFAAILQAAVASAAGTEPVAAFVDAVIDGFFSVYGEYPLTILLEELAISRDDLVADAQAFATTALRGVHADGQLEPLVRARLAPFFSSPAARALLDPPQ
jgi:hypothetical protein